MSIHVDTSEVRALAVHIKSSAPSIGPKARAALRRTAFAIQGDAMVTAPVDTGNLKNSISASVTGDTAEIGPTADYGHYVELGTSRMHGQPYMGPAFDRQIPGLQKALAQLAAEVFD